MTLEFAKSPRSTLGVEWELQLVDVDSGDLRQCAGVVLAQIEREHPQNGLVHHEMMLNTVEITSRPREIVRDAIRDIRQGISLLRPVTDQLRIDLTSAGSHPYANPIYQHVTDKERYRDLVLRTQYWGRQMLLFGTHVHVGIEKRDKVLPLLSYVASKLGHIQAIFASSPYWAGTDTGYCDNRAMVFQQLPTAGQPRQFASWPELENYTDSMLKTNVINSFDEIRWDIRPSPKFGTLEARVADASSNFKELAACAALIQSLVETGSRIIDRGEPLPILPEWLVGENRWRAARYGIDATLIENQAGDQACLRETLPGWIESLLPAAEDLGCAAELSFIPEMVKIGLGYERQRKVWKQEGSLEAVVEFLQAEFKAGQPLEPELFKTQSPGIHTPDDSTMSQQ